MRFARGVIQTPRDAPKYYFTPWSSVALRFFLRVKILSCRGSRFGRADWPRETGGIRDNVASHGTTRHSDE